MVARVIDSVVNDGGKLVLSMEGKVVVVVI